MRTFAETAIVYTVYSLLTKENKFSLSVCSKQAAVCRFRFTLQHTGTVQMTIAVFRELCSLSVCVYI
jgi:hypothetical protein